MTKRRKKSGGGASWMDTYGDMVTLLLCFFVLLYSMSTLDQQKWEQIVQAFNPDQIVQVQEPQGNGGPNQEIVNEKIDAVYDNLKAYIEMQGLEQTISVTRGGGYVFITFDDTVFFDGNSSVLREDGQQMLNAVADILAQGSDAIDEIRVLGHTAQADPNQPNNVRVDRMLASNRAVEVLIYLQEKNVIDPARLVNVGYGQWRPVSSNEDGQGRAANRRVELVISGLDVATEDSIAQYYTDRDTASPIGGDLEDKITPPTVTGAAAPDETTR